LIEVAVPSQESELAPPTCEFTRMIMDDNEERGRKYHLT
jgi:hypothetical protein